MAPWARRREQAQAVGRCWRGGLAACRGSSRRGHGARAGIRVGRGGGSGEERGDGDGDGNGERERERRRRRWRWRVSIAKGSPGGGSI